MTTAEYTPELEEENVPQQKNLKALSSGQLWALFREAEWILYELENVIVGRLPEEAQEEQEERLEQGYMLCDLLKIEIASRALTNLQAQLLQETPVEATTPTTL